MLSNVALALGLLLAPASQLRIGSVGPGELLLLLWVVLTIFRFLLTGDNIATRAFIQLLVFWSLFAASLCIGAIVAIVTDEALDVPWFLHDAAVYPVLAMIACLLVAGRNAQAQLEHTAWLLVVMGGVSLAVLAAGALDLVTLPFDMWYWQRFRGWSQNPNQLSELCGAILLVCFHLFDISRTWRSRVLLVICAMPCFYVGIMSDSDTFRYAMLAASLAYVAFKVHAALNIEWNLASASKVAVTLAVFAYSALLIMPLQSDVFDASGFVAVMSKQGGKEASHEAKLRTFLWKEAAYRGLVDTALLGLGPGPHLEIPAEIAAGRLAKGYHPKNTDHPDANGKANFESHNTYLDVFIQGGLLGIVSFLWLLWTALSRAVICKRVGLVALMAGLGVFMLTGNIIRIPTLWFGLALCLLTERETAPAPWRASVFGQKHLDWRRHRTWRRWQAAAAGEMIPPAAIK